MNNVRYAPINQTTNFPQDMIALTFRRGDTIDVIADTDQMKLAHDWIKTAILRSWSKGIQKDYKREHQLSIQLKGSPWYDLSRSKTVYNRILEEFGRKGFSCQEIVSHQGSGADMVGTVFFHYDEDTCNRFKETSIFCLTFAGDNQIKLYDAPSELTERIREAIQRCWPKGIKREGFKDKGKVKSCYKFLLNGHLWGSVEHIMLIGTILKAASEAGHRQLGCGAQAMGLGSYFYETGLVGDTSEVSSLSLVIESDTGIELPHSEPQSVHSTR
eukprot:TRINITY_DN17286_c0_g1_i1.p1 TRINITY_DN17286_c0_g1~~TRINITY_DN17286_c0_g1_i1.p1  ORF type:complete len:272 (-),score=42.14 TRINITY_DN17286_c0_g1_i1:67-882(-)